MKNWKFKVVKMMRGMQGEWFAFPAAGTFATQAEAEKYAASFAAEQKAAGLTTARYTVRTRGGKYVSEVSI